MMKNLAILLIPLFGLAGCATAPEVIVRTEIKVVDVPANLFVCPVMKNYPNYKTLTDGQLASLIIELSENNRQCHSSMVAVQKYLNAARNKLEETK